MTDLPRPAWMSAKDRDYLQRLMVRKGTLDLRLATTQLRNNQEIEKERNALEWAIEKLSVRPEATQKWESCVRCGAAILSVYPESL